MTPIWKKRFSSINSSFERDTGATLLCDLPGDSLITREEPLHRERRRVLEPAFHRNRLRITPKS
jgi:cytochrome P450